MDLKNVYGNTMRKDSPLLHGMTPWGWSHFGGAYPELAGSAYDDEGHDEPDIAIYCTDAGYVVKYSTAPLSLSKLWELLNSVLGNNEE